MMIEDKANVNLTPQRPNRGMIQSPERQRGVERKASRQQGIEAAKKTLEADFERSEESVLYA